MNQKLISFKEWMKIRSESTARTRERDHWTKFADDEELTGSLHGHSTASKETVDKFNKIKSKRKKKKKKSD